MGPGAENRTVVRCGGCAAAVLAVLAGSACRGPGWLAAPRFEIAAIPAAISVDGDLSDWHGLAFHEVTHASGVQDPGAKPVTGADDLSFRFAVAHDETALYVAVEVFDDVVVADSCAAGAVSAPAWDDDAVEVFLDGNHNRAPDSRVEDGSELRYGGEFSLIANGAAMSDYSGYPGTFGDRWSGATNWDRVQDGLASNMVYEFRLPWPVMGLTERPASIGFTLSVQDDDDGARRDHALYWTGALPFPFRDESGFGTVRLD